MVTVFSESSSILFKHYRLNRLELVKIALIGKEGPPSSWLKKIYSFIFANAKLIYGKTYPFKNFGVKRDAHIQACINISNYDILGACLIFIVDEAFYQN